MRKAKRMHPPEVSSDPSSSSGKKKKKAGSANQTSLYQAFSKGCLYQKKKSQQRTDTNAQLCKDMASPQTADTPLILLYLKSVFHFLQLDFIVFHESLLEMEVT